MIALHVIDGALPPKMKHIQTPDKTIIESYLHKWDTLENFVAQERALKLLFSELSPANDNIDHILLRTCVRRSFIRDTVGESSG